MNMLQSTYASRSTEKDTWHNGDATHPSPCERHPKKSGPTSDNEPCMCVAQRLGLGCTSFSCRNEVKVRNPKPPLTSSVRSLKPPPDAAQDPFFDSEFLKDEQAVESIRRLQHNGNSDDMSIPTHVDEDPYETGSDFDNELGNASSDDEGPGSCPLELTRQAKAKHQKVHALMPAKSSSSRKAHKARALALIDSTHAVTKESSRRNARVGVDASLSSVGVRVPRKARRKLWRKWICPTTASWVSIPGNA